MKIRGFISAIAMVAVFPTMAAFAMQSDQPGNVSPAPGTSNNAISATKDAAGHAVGTISAEMTTTLGGFVTAAATNDMYEVEAGKIAMDRSTDKGIKEFAAKMIQAHTQTTKQLTSLLSDMKSDIQPPAQLDDRRQGMINELRGAKNGDFDQRYLSQQIDAHKEAIILMRGYAKDGDTPSVREFASKTESAMRLHLAMAKELVTAPGS